MNKIFITLLASTGLTVAALAQTESLVAAWDFNYTQSFGGLDIDGDFSPDSSAPATFGDSSATFSWTDQSTGGLANGADLDSNQLLRPVQLDTMGEGFGWLIDANGSPDAQLALNVDLSAFAGGSVELTFAAGSQNGPVTLDVSAGGTTSINLDAGADALQTVDISSLAGDSNATVSFSFRDFTTIDNVLIDNIQIVGVEPAGGGGSLFILDNPASSLLVENWYRTPMGDIFTGSSPWLWSNDYGWFYSPETNTESAAYIYIQSSPFEGWVYVDQASATSDGFWGYAFNASEPALNGWFWFFNPDSTEDSFQYYLWDNEQGQTLVFPDAAQSRE